MGAALGIITAIFQFFASPLGRYVAIALVGLGLWVAGDLHGTRHEKAKWDAANLQAQIAKHKLEAEAATAAANEANRQLAEQAKINDDLTQKVNAYVTELDARKDAVCRVGADAARLRELAGDAGTAGNKNPVRLRPYRRPGQGAAHQ